MAYEGSITAFFGVEDIQRKDGCWQSSMFDDEFLFKESQTRESLNLFSPRIASLILLTPI